MFDASSVNAGTHKKMPWRCSKGHEWEAVVKSRASGASCPFCSNTLVLSGFNDLATTHPELTSEALFDATSVIAGSHRKLPWRCAKGHEWEAVVGSRVDGAGCPVCAGKRVWPGLNDLATLHPDVAAEAMFDPSTVTASSGRKMPWRCNAGHEWEAPVSNRTAQGQGCPYCANRRVLIGFNDLATTHPELVAAAMFDATAVTFGSKKRVRWKCPQRHEWDAPVAWRASSGEGCPVCAGKVVIPGVNDLASQHPELISEALFDASTVTSGSNRKTWWRCKQRHEWVASVKSRVAGRGCPFCSNKQVLPGFNDLATTHPELALEALFDPTRFSYGSSKHLEWRCAKGHEWTAAPLSRASKGNGCPFCSNKQVLPGFNDLDTRYPQIAAEALFDPTTVTSGSHSKKPWRCSEGHEWVAMVKSRTMRGTGCPSCAATGYNPSKPGWVYLMRQPIWEMMQIGIANDINSRVHTHQRNGWELLDARGPIAGDAARSWEVAILNLLSSRGVDLVPSTLPSMPSSSGLSKLGTAGEAWWESAYTVDSLQVLMEAVRESEWSVPPQS